MRFAFRSLLLGACVIMALPADARDFRSADIHPTDYPTVEAVDPRTLWVTVPDPHPNGKAEIAFAKGMIPRLLPLLDDLCRTKGKGC